MSANAPHDPGHADHGHAAHGHAPAPAEITNPALWTAGLLIACGLLIWGFFHFYALGAITARQHGRIEKKVASAAPIDHQKLISDRSQAVLDRGEQVYGKNCVACHGPKGDMMQAGARNFRTEAYKAEWGGGPHGFYLTLTNSYKAMPAFTNLSPADRYAVAHYIRETMSKPANGAYVADDAPAVAKLIPAPGGAAESAKEIDPAAIAEPALTHQLMAVMATESADRVALAKRWIDGLPADPDVALVRTLAETRPQWLTNLHAASINGLGAPIISDLLTGSNGLGSPEPTFALMAQPRLEALVKRLAGDRK